MKLLEINEIYIPACTDKYQVYFENCTQDNKYSVLLQIINEIDSNPLFPQVIVTHRNRYGFGFQLSTPMDSSNYKLQYSIWGKEEVKAEQMGQSGQVLSIAGDEPKWVDMPSTKINDVGVTKAVCSHKWKTYTGFTDKYEYCEHCDVKRN